MPWLLRDGEVLAAAEVATSRRAAPARPARPRRRRRRAPARPGARHPHRRHALRDRRRLLPPGRRRPRGPRRAGHAPVAHRRAAASRQLRDRGGDGRLRAVVAGPGRRAARSVTGRPRPRRDAVGEPGRSPATRRLRPHHGRCDRVRGHAADREAARTGRGAGAPAAGACTSTTRPSMVDVDAGPPRARRDGRRGDRRRHAGDLRPRGATRARPRPTPGSRCRWSRARRPGVAALVVSGLPTGRWVFEGFLPRKGRDAGERLAAVAAEPRTVGAVRGAPPAAARPSPTWPRRAGRSGASCWSAS